MSDERALWLKALRHATRPARFATDDEDYPIATQGGTVTLVEFNKKVLAVTCGHVASGFELRRLIIPTRRVGGECARVARVRQVHTPFDYAVDSDVLDIVAVELAPENSSEWFGERPLTINEERVVDCDEDDILVICGFPNEMADWSLSPAQLYSYDFQVKADRRNSRDIVLRSATGNVPLKSLSGFSGSPVVRERDGRLCGLVVRGGVSTSGDAQVFFVEASDILQVLKATEGGSGTPHRYDKMIVVSELPFPLSELK